MLFILVVLLLTSGLRNLHLYAQDKEKKKPPRSSIPQEEVVKRFKQAKQKKNKTRGRSNTPREIINPSQQKKAEKKKAPVTANPANPANPPGEIIKPTKQEKGEKKKTPGALSHISEEIIKRSKLDKIGKKKFSIQRDIFSPDPMKPADPLAAAKRPPPPPPPVIEPALIKKVEVDEKENIENQIRGSLFYEGYVIKHSKNYALVSMNGEFYAVTSGDMVLERIKINKIDRKAVTVEVETHTFEIQLKGDEENEIQ